MTLVASPDTTVNLGPTTELPYYTIAVIDDSGYASGYAVQALLPPTTDTPALPVAWRFKLHPSTPNPFNPMTTVRFELDRAGPARVEVFEAQPGLADGLEAGNLLVGQRLGIRKFPLFRRFLVQRYDIAVPSSLVHRQVMHLAVQPRFGLPPGLELDMQSHKGFLHKLDPRFGDGANTGYRIMKIEAPEDLAAKLAAVFQS